MSDNLSKFTQSFGALSIDEGRKVASALDIPLGSLVEGFNRLTPSNGFRLGFRYNDQFKIRPNGVYDAPPVVGLIQTIAGLRNATGWGLKESKDFVDIARAHPDTVYTVRALLSLDEAMDASYRAVTQDRPIVLTVSKG